MGRARKESEQQLAASVREVTNSMSDTVSKAAVKAVTKATQNFEKTAGERATASSSVFSPESGDSEVLWHRRLHSSMLQQQFSQHHHVTDRLMDLVQNNQSTVSASSVAIIPEKKECASCEACGTQKAALKCHDCDMLYCNSCSASFHSLGKLKEHQIHTTMCQMCTGNLATLLCKECGVAYCQNCSTTVHSKGALKKHCDSITKI